MLVRRWICFDIYLHNVLEYAKILVTGGKFMIFDIEGHSTGPLNDKAADKLRIWVSFFT